MAWLRSLPLAALLLGLGCENNTITLETSPDPGDDSTTAGDVTGDTAVDDDTTAGDPNSPHTLLFAMLTPFDPNLPWQALVTTAPHGSTIDLTLQFLSLDKGSSTTPRQLVGSVHTAMGLALDANGGFVWDTGVIPMPAEAEPIVGNALTLNLEIQGAVGPAGGPLYCGMVAGRVMDPFSANLVGSTYAMTEVTGVADLPTMVVSACP